jgi:hypothetical protein
MSGTHRLSPERSISLGSTAKIATKLLLVSTLAVIAFCLLAAPVGPVHASGGGSLSTGTITWPGTGPYNCLGADWFAYTDSSGNVHYMSCYQTTVNCPNTQAMPFKYGYLSPLGIAPGINTPANVQGLVVYFNGKGGEDPAGSSGNSQDEQEVLGYYFTQGYEIVQMSWSSDWEATYDPFPNGTYGNIQNAACRPATFLSYVYSNLYAAISNPNTGNPNAGMCAQGASAGSAQVAYSMAYYGAGSYLDNVELISGPVFSDIDQGCEEPNAPNVTVCGPTNYKGGQYGCNLGTDTPWTLSPRYLYPTNNDVGGWTNDSYCGNLYPVTTSPQSDTRWLNQSIVDQSTGGSGQGAIPMFSYTTAMTGWLCASVASGGGPPNNSSPQGQIFYANIGVNNSPPHYNVYSVDNCSSAEFVYGGTVSGVTSDPSGLYAVMQDMAGGTAGGTALLPAQCFHGTHTQGP